MLFGKRFLWCLGVLLLALLPGGCSLSGENPLDDEKDPAFVRGKSLVNAQDFAGAAQSFQDALENSPRSAAAHFQLAWLYENKLADPAAAIYHYQEYLRLDPKAGNPDVIRQHIYACKQQLAKDIMDLPSTPAAQQQLEKLADQNRRMQDELDKWHTYYAAQIAAHPNPGGLLPTPANPQTAPRPLLPAGPPNLLTPTNSAPPPVLHALPPPPIQMQTHVVARNETMAAIARNAKISLPALLAVNPGVNPKHLRTGQTINLPPP